ncbi:MAG: hypothetical protein HY788_03085 [Deltaproteobacteria bacterium]|nr:hypothetical protein [Deltaproteobacteria bacterium]
MGNVPILRVFLFLWTCLFAFLCLAPEIRGVEAPSKENPPSNTGLLNRILDPEKFSFGGHFKNRVAASWPDSDSLFRLVGLETLWDYQSVLRLKGQYRFADWAQFEAHNETFYLVSDTRRATRRLEEILGVEFPQFLGIGAGLDDDRRLMDLTWTLDEGDGHLLVNRFDRLFFTVFYEDTVFKLGRQAVTWGHGLIFNPMDVFSPFAPTTLDREYKQGDDAALLNVPLDERYGDMTLLYVARKDFETGNPAWEASSLAGKYHWFVPGSQTELTFILGKHYEDLVSGLGAVGYLGGAACRMDTTWTYLDEENTSFFSFVANLDYAWNWWGYNMYGWVEYYFNGLGEERKKYVDAFFNEALLDRLERGELFVVGRHYVDTQIRIELHPLVNVYFNTITNVVDPSGILQPYLVWDVSTNLQFTLASTVFWGGNNTEYGGVEIPPLGVTDQQPNRVFSWLTWYF